MTTKELSYVNDVLSAEKTIITKYQDYSTQVTDQSLKNLCTQMMAKHQQSYDSIYNQLNV